MSDKNKAHAIIINALAWAAAILMVSWLTKGAVDAETSFMMTMFLVAGWFATNGLVSGQGLTARQEIECLKNRFKK